MKIKISRGPLSLSELASWIGGKLVLHGYDRAPAVDSVCTDSREVGPGTLLCAIRGERVDGHRFLAGACMAGCGSFLCERIPPELSASDAPWAALVVPDTVAALAPLAAAYRRTYLPSLCAVGVTGSVGKTSTKELCADILSVGAPTFCREGNFNSVIGLPLSVMEIDPSCRRAVLEMGMSARGEISAMTSAVRPDIALITNVGSSHLEHLGTRENIARAKLEILEGVRSGGYLLVPGDEPLIDRVLPEVSRPDVTVWRVSAVRPDADVFIDRVRLGTADSRFDLTLPDGQGGRRTLSDLCVPALGAHIVYNASLAVTAGILAGIDEADIRAGLSLYRPAALRQAVTRLPGITLFEDCYNAAPESMRAALDVLGTLAGQAGTSRRVAVLGDMRELGADTVSMHRRTGAYCVEKGVDILVTVGALGAEIAQGAQAAGMTPDRVTVLYPDGGEPDPAVIADAAEARLLPGDIVLFKASRALALERVSGLLKARFDRK
ncbi:MAG: UDP-N-acetylmuramoyl-tripeptide--D-alanyl-D-alanine ligase [Clostridia bacterium]|nr:UDP-N-acetylmuramoyl-tripeptide--D-alanyl-D-alanine ligase [Clostridia bacterium]